jgi:hypothetical protein
LQAKALKKSQDKAAKETVKDGSPGWLFAIVNFDRDVKPYLVMEGTWQQIMAGTAVNIS